VSDEPTYEGRAICGADCAACTCVKPPGHVEAGDPLHECGRACTGAWTGTWEEPDWEVVRFPFPKYPDTDTATIEGELL